MCETTQPRTQVRLTIDLRPQPNFVSDWFDAGQTGCWREAIQAARPWQSDGCLILWDQRFPAVTEVLRARAAHA